MKDRISHLANTEKPCNLTQNDKIMNKSILNTAINKQAQGIVSFKKSKSLRQGFVCYFRIHQDKAMS